MLAHEAGLDAVRPPPPPTSLPPSPRPPAAVATPAEARAPSASSSIPAAAQPQQPRQLDMMSDPSRLLALYPIGGPHVPSASVAHHLAPLANAPLDIRQLVPEWHRADDFQEQLRVLESGTGSSELERAWFQRQLEAVGVACGVGAAPAGNSGAATVPFGQLVASLLPPSPAPAPSPTRVDPSESSAFFASFISDTLATMAAAPITSSQPSSRSYASPTSSQGSLTPTKATVSSAARRGSNVSSSRRRSSPAEHPIASTSRTNGAPYQPSPLGPRSSPVRGGEYEHPPSSSPIVSHAGRTRTVTGTLPPQPTFGAGQNGVDKIKLKRPRVASTHGNSGSSPTKRVKDDDQATPTAAAKGKGRESNGVSDEHKKSRTGGKTPNDSQRKLVDYVQDILEAVDTLPTPLLASHPFLARPTSGSAGQPYLKSDALRRLDSLLAGVRIWPSVLEESDGDRLVSVIRAGVEEEDCEDDVVRLDPAKPVEESPRKKASDEMEVEDTLVVSSGFSSPSYGGFDSTPPRPQSKKAATAASKGEESTRRPEAGERELERGLSAGILWKLMSLPGVPKLHFSEELIATLTTHLADLLKTRIFPSLQSSVAPANLPSLARSATFQLASLARLLNAGEADIVLSEDAVIRLVPLAVGPFFAQSSVAEEAGIRGKGKGKRQASDSAVKGREGLKEIRLEALSVLRAIFGRYESQRAWVIQEVLTSLVKLPDIKKAQKQFRLRDGQAIHIVTALLLQLVQSCAHGVRQQIRGRRLRDESRMIVDGQPDDVNDAPVSCAEAEKEEAHIYATSCEAAARIAKSIASFLTVSSASSKAAKSSEKEHRAVLDIVLQDLLTILYWPEWPAAGQVLMWFCKLMITSLKDDKVSAEENASKSIALDQLGHIAARMRVSSNRAAAREREPASDGTAGAQPLADIVRKADVSSLRRLELMQVTLLTHLRRAANTDLFLLTSYEHTACLWGQELSAESLRLPTAPAGDGGDALTHSSQGDGGVGLGSQLAISDSVRSSLAALWAEPESQDVFLEDSDEQPTQIDDISEEISLSRPFGRAFDAILSAVLFALDSHSVTFRTKALRALGHILATDSAILTFANVRRAIENKLSDPSPAVRDVAVELIGHYLVVQPSLVEKYLPRLAERADDSGLAVRKRVIKLLKTIYGTLPETSLQAMIAIRLIERADDEDESVKDLAVKTIEELWFSDLAERAHSSGLGSFSPATTAGSSALERKTVVVMTVAGHFRERHSALEVFLTQIVGDKDVHPKHASDVFQHFKQVCEALIDTLIDAHDRPSLDVAGCVHALNQFSAAYPDCVSSSKASHLLPYLRHSQAPDEQAVSISLLRIFNRSIRKMPRTSLSFAQNLEKKVLPLINGAMGGWVGLQESIACLCVIVDHLTQNHERLVRLLGSCVGKLEHMRRRYQQTGHMPEPKVQNQTRPLLYIVALLGEHCDFDELRAKNEGLASELNAISEDFMSEYIFDLVAFFDKAPVAPDFRRAALQSLGFLFRGYPTLMVEPSSLNVMDSVFASTDLPTKAVLLDVILDFLLTQVERVKKDPGSALARDAVHGVNMTELIGDTDKFAESGVGSTIVQRYLMQILDAAQHALTERVAVEIITFTVRQGLAHPIELTPVVIALETSSNPALSERAFSLHAFLHHKYNSIVNTRFVENARACYAYQCKTAGGAVRGFRLEVTIASAEPVAEALLGRWFNLVREKRPTRKDYLRHLVRPFDFDTMADPSQLHCTPSHVGFCRFLADNLAAFDYKTQEEVFVVIERLTAIISVTGTHLFDLLARAKLDFADNSRPVDGQRVAVQAAARGRGLLHLTELSSEADELPLGSDDTARGSTGSSSTISYDAQTLANLSIVSSLAFLLKAHLKALYQLSEDKCRKYDAAGKKSSLGDKAAVRRPGVALTLDLEPIPFALEDVETLGDVAEQCLAFITIAEEDGTNFEPDDDSA